MDSLKNIISDMRVFLYGGLRALPLTIAGTLIILGLMTANYAILFFLVGFLIAVPLLAQVLNSLMDFISSILHIDWFKVSGQTDVCQLVIPFVSKATNAVIPTSSTVFSSLWTSMISFFFGYIITNGIALYNRPALNPEISVGSQPVSGVTTRTSQAMISIITSIIVFMGIIGYRLFSGCENKLSMVLSVIIFGLLGVSWYKILSMTGQDRLSDLFGIANRLLPPTAVANGPIACIPIKA